MFRPVLFALAMCLGVLCPAPLRADDFAIDLEASAGKKTKTAHAEAPAAGTKPQPRATLTASVDAPITVKWSLGNKAAKATRKDVLVHFFAVKIARPGQQEVPKLTGNVLAESALTMDFKPGDRTEGEITFAVTKPGCYLLRVETRGAALKEGHEPFAALDLVVR